MTHDFSGLERISCLDPWVIDELRRREEEERRRKEDDRRIRIYIDEIPENEVPADEYQRGVEIIQLYRS